MERKYSSLRFVITTTLVAEGLLSACSPRNSTNESPTTTPLLSTATLINQTSTPDFRDFVPTYTPIPIQTESTTQIFTIEQKFTLGSFDAAKTPFSVKFSEDLNSLLGFIPGANKELTADIPLPIKVPTFGTEEQLKVFEKAAIINIDGNPYYVITTDQSNHLFFYFHSITSTSVGEVARKITTFMMQHPGRTAQSVMREKVTMTINNKPTSAEIVAVEIMDRDEFTNMGEGSPWGVYSQGDNILFARTDKFRIPDSIRNDSTPGTYYITIVSCQSEDGKIYPLRSQNVQKRALVTLKIQIP